MPLPAAETAYRGPRYQGFPPQYQPERERRDSEQVVSDGEAEGLEDDQPDRPAPLVVPKLSRSRRSPRGERETRTRAQEQEHQPTAADTVV